MPHDPSAIFSISMDNNTPSIRINAIPGSKIETNATHAEMHWVEQISSGGIINHTMERKLTQIGGSQKSTNGGQIINSVQDGQLLQYNVEQTADGGLIKNEVIKKVALGAFLAILAGWGVLAEKVWLFADISQIASTVKEFFF